MLDQLSRNDRLRLMKFVCSFAWVDLEIQAEEREFVHRLIRRLELDDADRARVEGWLAHPPEPEAVDPTRVPPAHRQVFLEAIRGVIAADGRIVPEERAAFDIFRDLVE